MTSEKQTTSHQRMTTKQTVLINSRGVKFHDETSFVKFKGIAKKRNQILLDLIANNKDKTMDEILDMCKYFPKSTLSSIKAYYTQATVGYLIVKPDKLEYHESKPSDSNDHILCIEVVTFNMRHFSMKTFDRRDLRWYLNAVAGASIIALQEVHDLQSIKKLVPEDMYEIKFQGELAILFKKQLFTSLKVDPLPFEFHFRNLPLVVILQAGQCKIGVVTAHTRYYDGQCGMIRQENEALRQHIARFEAAHKDVIWIVAGDFNDSRLSSWQMTKTIHEPTTIGGKCYDNILVDKQFQVIHSQVKKPTSSDNYDLESIGGRVVFKNRVSDHFPARVQLEIHPYGRLQRTRNY